MTTNTKTIVEYFEADHDRLDGLFRQFQALKNTDYAAAKPFFREFKFGLQRHIIWEEEILFPLFEQKSGITQGGPTEVMRMEHRMIGKHLEDVHAYVRRMDPASDDEEQMLLNVLAMHNQKEELILYPAIDRSITDEDVLRIFEQMESIPEERYRTCCGHSHAH